MSTALSPFTFAGEPPLIRGAEHHLYLVEIRDAGIKVGITTNPAVRVAAHQRAAAAHGREVGRVWVSAPHQEARENERALVRLAGPKQRREYLPLNFSDVLLAATQLPMTRADRAQVEAKREAVADFFKAFVTGGAR